MAGVHSVSGGLEVGQATRMASSTTPSTSLAPGIGGELSGRTPISTHVEIYSYRIQHANKHPMNWLALPDEY